MSKVFIDCGTSYFQGFKQLDAIHEFKNFTCFCFECNPITFYTSKPIYNELISSGYNISHQNKAAGIDNNLSQVNIVNVPGENSVSTNTLPHKPIGDPGRGIIGNGYVPDTIYVNTFNVIELIRQQSGNIILKLDIEGSEYDILDELIATQLYTKIDKLYVEFHPDMMQDSEVAINKEIKYRERLSDIIQPWS